MTKLAIKEIIENVIDQKIKIENPSIEQVEEWDSLAHINIMLEIESAFCITIPIEIIPELTSLEKIFSFLTLNKT